PPWSALLGEGRRRRRLVCGRHVAPTQGFGVLELFLVEADLRGRPGPSRLNEERPVRLVLWEAFAELRRLVVDGAHAEPEAERLGLIGDPGLVHQRLAVDGVAAETHAPLQRGA